MYNHTKGNNNVAPTTSRKSTSVDIRQIFPVRKKDDFFKDLQKDINTYSKYLDLNNEWRNRFNTGIDLHLLQEYYVIALDVFKNNKYAKEKTELNAWLSLLTANSIDDLATLISDYPWMEKICWDMSEYLYRPKEVIGMYSQALAKADENTVNFMIEQMKKALEEKDVALSEKDAALSEKDAEIAALQAKLAALEH